MGSFFSADSSINAYLEDIYDDANNIYILDENQPVFDGLIDDNIYRIIYNINELKPDKNENMILTSITKKYDEYKLDYEYYLTYYKTKTQLIIILVNIDIISINNLAPIIHKNNFILYHNHITYQTYETNMHAPPKLKKIVKTNDKSLDNYLEPRNIYDETDPEESD